MKVMLQESYISQNYSNLTEFITNTRTALMSRRLIPGTHSIQIIFHNPPFKDMIRPSCNGLWMEFGVFRGATLTNIANWKRVFCGDNNQPVYGFDTFSGLPTDWRPGYAVGSFSIPNGTALSVPSNVIFRGVPIFQKLGGRKPKFSKNFTNFCKIFQKKQKIFDYWGGRRAPHDPPSGHP
jgi:hypothetical protein